MHDSIPIAMLNALAYCERRFGYEYVQAEMLVNEFVFEGQLHHASVDSGFTSWLQAGVQQRSLFVSHAQLKIHGKTDILEYQAETYQPVEYKRGKLGRWRNDHVQLCAQALCLETMFNCVISEGAIFSWASRRRETVAFDQELRDLTYATIERAHELAHTARLAPPTAHKAKCQACSLKPLCLPEEVRILHKI